MTKLLGKDIYSGNKVIVNSETLNSENGSKVIEIDSSDDTFFVLDYGWFDSNGNACFTSRNGYSVAWPIKEAEYDEIARKLSIVRTWLEGEAVQWRTKNKGHAWVDRVEGDHYWNWETMEHRIKPTNSDARERWVNIYDNGAELVYNSKDKAEAAFMATPEFGECGVHFREVLEK